MKSKHVPSISGAVRTLLTACVLLTVITGCAALRQVGQQTLGTSATQSLERSMSTLAYKGQAWNMPYAIYRAPGGEYSIRKLTGDKTTHVGSFESLKKVYSAQTNTFALDAFLAPTKRCTHRYLLVIGYGNDQGHFTLLGCRVALQFRSGTDNRIYATQTGVTTPEALAYAIGQTRITGPKPVSQLAGYPQRMLSSSGSRSTARTKYSGRVWNVAYTIEGAQGGEYTIRKRTSSKASDIGRFLSLKKVYSTQTDTFAVDAFLTPTARCPYHYFLVIGSGNKQGNFKPLGCTVQLSFQRSDDGLVYATQVGVAPATPLAYTIDARRLRGPKPITQLAGYPQHKQVASAAPASKPKANAKPHPPVTHDAGPGPLPVPAAAPSSDQPKPATSAPPAPVTIDLGG